MPSSVSSSSVSGTSTNPLQEHRYHRISSLDPFTVPCPDPTARHHLTYPPEHSIIRQDIMANMIPRRNRMKFRDRFRVLHPVFRVTAVPAPLNTYSSVRILPRASVEDLRNLSFGSSSSVSNSGSLLSSITMTHGKTAERWHH